MFFFCKDRRLPLSLAVASIVLLAGISPGHADELMFRGLPHTSLGTAELTPNADNTQLTVSNIGSSGEDGVSIDLGESGGWDGEWLPIDDTVSDGAWIEQIFYGNVDGTNDLPIVSMRCERLSAVENELTTHFPGPNPTTVRIEFYEGGSLVAFWPDQPAGQTLRQSGNPPKIQTDSHFTHIGTGEPCDDGPMYPCLFAGYTFPTSTAIVGLAPLVDEIRIYPENTSATAVDWISRVDVRASDIPEIVIFDEAVRLDGVPNRVLGEAVFETQNSSADYLTVGGIGASGEDGVRVDFAMAEEARLELDDGFLAEAPAGAAWEISAYGGLGSSDDELAATIRDERSADSFFDVDCWVDFNPSGSPTVRVELYEAGNLVAELPGQNGMVARLESAPIALAFRPRGTGQTTGHIATLSAGTTVQLGGLDYVCDEMVITGEGGVPLEHVSGIEMLGDTGMPLTITAEHAVPVEEPSGIGDQLDGLAESDLRFTVAPLSGRPSGSSTTLQFDLPEAGHLTAGIYDLAGRTIARLTDDRFSAGSHVLTWEGLTAGGVPAERGVYFVRAALRAASGQAAVRTQRILLLR